jgi:hypothetical protein
MVRHSARTGNQWATSNPEKLLAAFVSELGAEEANHQRWQQQYLRRKSGEQPDSIFGPFPSGVPVDVGSPISFAVQEPPRFSSAPAPRAHQPSYI